VGDITTKGVLKCEKEEKQQAVLRVVRHLEKY
jgi:hypothetical protein